MHARVLKWRLLSPPCSVGFAATSTSSSERLSQLHFSSWYTRTSSASGLCHGSPTSLMNKHTIELGVRAVEKCGVHRTQQETSCSNLKDLRTRGFIHLAVNKDSIPYEISKADNSSAAPAVLTLSPRCQHLGLQYTV